MAARARLKATGLTASAIVPRIERIYADVAFHSKGLFNKSDDAGLKTDSMTVN
jgi:hypothetical protein